MKGISLLDKFLSGLLVLLVLGLAYTTVNSISSYIGMFNAEKQRVGQPYCQSDNNACLEFNCGYDYLQTTYGEDCVQSLKSTEYTKRDFAAWNVNIILDVFIGDINSFLTLAASLIFTAIVKWLVGLVRKGNGVLTTRELHKTKIYGVAITLVAIFLSLLWPITLLLAGIYGNLGGNIPMFSYLREAISNLELFNLNVNMILIGIVLVVFAYALEKMMVYKAEVDLTI